MDNNKKNLVEDSNLIEEVKEKGSNEEVKLNEEETKKDEVETKKDKEETKKDEVDEVKEISQSSDRELDELKFELEKMKLKEESNSRYFKSMLVAVTVIIILMFMVMRPTKPIEQPAQPKDLQLAQEVNQNDEKEIQEEVEKVEDDIVTEESLSERDLYLKREEELDKKEYKTLPILPPASRYPGEWSIKDGVARFLDYETNFDIVVSGYSIGAPYLNKHNEEVIDIIFDVWVRNMGKEPANFFKGYRSLERHPKFEFELSDSAGDITVDYSYPKSKALDLTEEEIISGTWLSDELKDKGLSYNANNKYYKGMMDEEKFTLRKMKYTIDLYEMDSLTDFEMFYAIETMRQSEGVKTLDLNILNSSI